MPDMEKVIMALEKGIATAEAIEAITGGFVYITKGVARNALELLKEQEPVEPILALNDGEHKLWQCGNCKVAVFTHDSKYCHNCGKAVKWDE